MSVDSTSNRAYQHATNTTRDTGTLPNYTNLGIEPPDHGIGRSRAGLSSKIHLLAYGAGRPLGILIGPGQVGDSPMLPHLLDGLRIPRPCAERRSPRHRQTGRRSLHSVAPTPGPWSEVGEDLPFYQRRVNIPSHVVTGRRRLRRPRKGRVGRWWRCWSSRRSARPHREPEVRRSHPWCSPTSLLVPRMPHPTLWPALW